MIIPWSWRAKSINVLTGGPGSGKSTVLERLAQQGYPAVPEVARMLQDAGIKPERDYEAFERLVYRNQEAMDLYAISQRNEKPIIQDRSTIDIEAYCEVLEVSKPLKEDWMAHIWQKRGVYDQVFFFERLPIYVNDGVRTETLEQAKKIEQALRKAYARHKLDVIDVPVFSEDKEASIQARVDFIINRIGGS